MVDTTCILTKDLDSRKRIVIEHVEDFWIRDRPKKVLNH